MSLIEIILSIISFLSIGSLLGILLTKFLNRKKDSIELKKQSLSLIKEYNEELNKIIIELKNANTEKDELHEKELEEERTLRSKAEKEVVKYQEMLLSSQKQVDDLLDAHRKKDIQMEEKDIQIEKMQNIVNSQRLTINKWADNDIKKDQIIIDLKKRIKDREYLRDSSDMFSETWDKYQAIIIELERALKVYENGVK